MFFLDGWYSQKEQGSGQNKTFTLTFGEEKKTLNDTKAKREAEPPN